MKKLYMTLGLAVLLAGAHKSAMGMDVEAPAIKVQIANHTKNLVTTFYREKIKGYNVSRSPFFRDIVNPEEDSHEFTLNDTEHNELFVYASVGTAFRVIYQPGGYIEIADDNKLAGYKDYRVIHRSRNGATNLVISISPTGEINLAERA